MCAFAVFDDTAADLSAAKTKRLSHNRVRLVIGRGQGGLRLFLGLLAQPGDQIISVLALLETTEGHLGARNVFLWVFQVFIQSVLVPFDALLLVGICVGETFD